MGNGGFSGVTGALDRPQSRTKRLLQSSYQLRHTLIPDQPDKYSGAKRYDKFRTLPEVTIPVWTFDIARDSGIIAAAVSNSVHLWDMTEARPELRVSLSGHTDQVWATRFSSNESTLATGSQDKTIRLWETMTGTPLHVLEGHTAGVRCLAFSETGLLVSGGMDEQMMLWEFENDKPTCVWKGHDGHVHELAFSRTENHPAVEGNEFEGRHFGLAKKVIRDECLSTAGSVPVKGLWFAADRFAAQVNDKIYVVHFSAMGAMTVELDLEQEQSSKDKVLKKVRKMADKPPPTLESFRSTVLSATPFKFEPWSEVVPQTLISVGADGSVALWKCSPGRSDLFGRFAGGDGGGVLSAAAHPRNAGIVAAGNQDGAAWLWFFKPKGHAESDEVEVTGHVKLLGHKKPVWGVAFSPDGLFLATGSADGTVRVWQMAVEYCDRRSRSEAVETGPDGVRRSADGGKEPQPVQVCVFNAHEDGWVRQVRFSGKINSIVTCSTDGTVRTWAPPPSLGRAVQKEDKREAAEFKKKVAGQPPLQALPGGDDEYSPTSKGA